MRCLLVIRAYSASHISIPLGTSRQIDLTARLTEEAVEVTFGHGRAKRSVSVAVGEASEHVNMNGEQVRFYLCREGESSVNAEDNLRTGQYDLVRNLPANFFEG